MYHHRIADWDNAYTNGANIAGGDRWPDAWVGAGESLSRGKRGGGQGKARPCLWRPPAQPLRPVPACRRSEGPRRLHPWRLLDALRPEFSGRIWRRARSTAATRSRCRPTRSARRTALPASSPRSVQAVEKIAGMVGGPIHLTGHSAGGHLATRMVCTNSPLSDAVRRTASATSSRSPACTICGR